MGSNRRATSTYYSDKLIGRKATVAAEKDLHSKGYLRIAYGMYAVNGGRDSYYFSEWEKKDLYQEYPKFFIQELPRGQVKIWTN